MSDYKSSKHKIGKLNNTQLNVTLDPKTLPNVNTIHDKVMWQMLEDSYNYNDEPLRLIEKRLFDPKTKTAKFDVKESTVMKLMFLKPGSNLSV